MSNGLWQPTLLVDDLIRRSLPLRLREDLDGDDISLYGSIHVLSADEENRFVECWYRNIALCIMVRKSARRIA